MSAADNLGVVAALTILAGCSTAQPVLNPPTGSASSSGGSSGGTAATISGSSSGGGTSSTTGAGSSSGSTSGSSGGSSTSGGACETPALGFAGGWDTAFAQLDLVQDGGFVSGRYRDWGYAYQDPQFAGTLTGTVCGITLGGTIRANAATVPASLAVVLEENELQGHFTFPGQAPNPILGVPSDAGISLPSGSGWSFDNITIEVAGEPYEMTLVQTGDEADGAVLQENLNTEMPVIGVHGVVSDYRLNGEYVPLPGNGSPGRISFAMTPDGTQFSGNLMHNSSVFPWCGAIIGALPPVCLGGGGGYDGTWFTNLGTITLSQPLLDQGTASDSVSGVWFYWGSETEYPIAGTVTDGLSWNDASNVGGAISLLHVDPIGLTLRGFTAAGGLWCGVSYDMDAGVTYGTLPTGCGLSNGWQIAQGPGAATTLALTQIRGQVSGGFDALAIAGSVAANPDGGGEQPVVVSGTWSGAGSGTFQWFPDSDDETFSGDGTSGGVLGPWCGSLSGSPPAACLQ